MRFLRLLFKLDLMKLEITYLQLALVGSEITALPSPISFLPNSVNQRGRCKGPPYLREHPHQGFLGTSVVGEL